MSPNKKSDKILSATVSLFVREGVKKITMDDIAENINVSKVTIYKYFSDKDTLYLEVGRYIFSQYITMLNNVMSSGGDLIEKFYDFISVISSFISGGQYDLCAELTRYNRDVEAENGLYLQTYRNHMLTLIDDGIKSGLIKSYLDRDMVFHYIDMGVVYYHESPEYRLKMLGEGDFRKRFLLFFLNNIFTDGAEMLSAPYEVI